LGATQGDELLNHGAIAARAVKQEKQCVNIADSKE